jgi:hypothetical protein
MLVALTLGRATLAEQGGPKAAPAASRAQPTSAPAAPKAPPAASAKPAAAAPKAAQKAPQKPAQQASAGTAKSSKPRTKIPSPTAPNSASRPGPAGSSSPAGAAGPTGKTLDETHILKLRDLESRIDELKEQIRRSHARLSLLSETLLSGGLGGARADVVFKNQMSNAFRIRRILVVLDGAVQYKKQDDTDELSNQKEIPVFTGPIPPGDHTLQIVVGMQGHGYGVFSYLKAFKPEVKHTRSFTVEEGKAIRIEITAWEKGSATTPLEQRPALRLTEKIVDRREAELDGAE